MDVSAPTIELQSGAGEECVDTLLVTANVGSLFEDPERLLRAWMVVFLRKISELRPKFLALHLQEVGGKTYEKSMEYVQEFITRLCEAPEMQCFEFIRVYMDEDFKSAEHFTALGNLYFIHKNVINVRVWNFFTHSWEKAEGKHIYTGNIEAISTKEKSKFPQHFFPECKWSRKGFMRTRWEINKTVFDLVNIHLFHDASNLAACEEFPSVYCKTRRRALVHTLERFHLDEKNGFAPFFLFGDFNFRCDTEGVVKELTENLTAHRVQSMKSDSTKIHYRNSVGDNILTVGKKEFNHADHQLKFKEAWLKKFDRELDPLRDFLNEFSIEFSPSYPYEEDPEMPTDFMSTRCPSWCDRVLISPQAMNIIDVKESPNMYNIIGENVCMGDHKPVYLNMSIKTNQGTYSRCNCHSINANINKSTTLPSIPAVTVIISRPIDDSFLPTGCCPYGGEIFNELLLKCKPFNKAICGPISRDPTKLNFKNNTGSFDDIDSDRNLTTQYNYNNPNDEKFSNSKAASQWPTVSINVIDTDNIHVCMCSQISSTNDCVADGGICPQCQNIIKKQAVEPRYRLVSKRLILSNNIIVNRIDTQHLSTYFDCGLKCQDPYTPESAESHSPCLELNSSTSNSNNSQISSSEDKQLLDNECDIRGNQARTEMKPRSHSADAHHIGDVKQQRGTVSAGQLKLRLEDLQKRSSKQNFKLINTNDCCDAVESGVDDIDDMCLTKNAPLQRYPNNCLPKCCNIH